MFVDNADGITRKFSFSSLTIGAVVITELGTSVPELLVSVLAVPMLIVVRAAARGRNEALAEDVDEEFLPLRAERDRTGLTESTRDVAPFGKAEEKQVEVEEPGEGPQRLKAVSDLVVSGIVIEAEEATERVPSAYVIAGVHLESSEPSQEDILCRPSSNPSNLEEPLLRTGTTGLFEFSFVQGSSRDGMRNVVQIAGLPGAESEVS